MHDENHRLAHTGHELPEGLRRCIVFHGHLCPGLVYGYMVATQAMELLGTDRSRDEEVVAISENDTCAVDALQILLGTTIGKGNLILKDYGKNAFLIFDRSENRAFRFSRKSYYEYDGEHKSEFAELEATVAAGRATAKQHMRQKWLKALDLLAKPFDVVFHTEETEYPEVPYAPLARSQACARCGELTMATKMIETDDGVRLCVPCARESRMP